mgnify:CR=1 FL=1
MIRFLAASIITILAVPAQSAPLTDGFEDRMMAIGFTSEQATQIKQVGWLYYANKICGETTYSNKRLNSDIDFAEKHYEIPYAMLIEKAVAYEVDMETDLKKTSESFRLNLCRELREKLKED